MEVLACLFSNSNWSRFMLVAVPSDSPGGLEARISDHFGHCDVFTLVQVEEQQMGSVTILPNDAHESGQCMAPVMLLKEQGAEALIAGGMGMRPLSGFQEVGITVYFKAGSKTVRDAIELLMAGECRQFAAAQTCAGQGQCASPEQVEREVVDGRIEKDRVALVAFRLTDAGGELIDAAEGVHYLHGHGQLLPGLEKALEGLVAGDHAKATLSPEDAYGERDESRVVQAATEDLPAGVAPGAMVHAQLPQGGRVPLTVVSIEGPAVTLDGNHPLAGKTLVFEVEVRKVYAAAAEDLRHGHVH
jgi:FKBP-type peptidyl-prolyl cis-trans isomerase 2/predicted Fe-Mo cluster-binding NifX family protein